MQTLWQNYLEAYLKAAVIADQRHALKAEHGERAGGRI
jgi:hypothetical protein